MSRPIVSNAGSISHLGSYPIRRWRVVLAGRQIDVLGPANEDELLDSPAVEARFEADEYMPYWGRLWPAAVMFAEHILTDEPGRSRAALEVGCGLGLPAVAARIAGWDVLATDCDEDALRFASETARLNGIADLPVRLVDWRRPDPLGRFDRILASDVLYEQSNHSPLVELIHSLLSDDGIALVCDPNREPARGFGARLTRCGLSWKNTATHANQPYGRYVDGTIYQIRRPRTECARS